MNLAPITTAKMAANELNRAIRDAHHSACADDLLLEILLRDLIADAVKLQNRLAEIEEAAR